MTSAALALVIFSGICHATWNLLLKQSDHKTSFLALASAVGGTALLGPAIAAALVTDLSARGFAFGCVTGTIHGVYGLSLARGYRLGDLSSVYPVARGAGLALVPVAAAMLLGEEISIIAAFGIAMVIAGIYAIHITGSALSDLTAPLRALRRNPGTQAALMTGVLISMYYLWDKHALDEELSPVVLNQFAMTGHTLITAGAALLTSPASLRAEWTERRLAIIVSGVLIVVAYLLVLIALETSQVSYVAPAREIGIVFGAVIGVLLLGEGAGLWRVWAAVLIVGGVITLGLAP
jgi:multidrug transporter EmrE-like cation transporter